MGEGGMRGSFARELSGLSGSEGESDGCGIIDEIFGLTDWVRGVADQLAEAGYIAIPPDLLSGTAPGGGGTKELGSGDAVRKAISSLPPDQSPPT